KRPERSAAAPSTALRSAQDAPPRAVEGRPVRETDPLESSGSLNIGYAQSKWVAEKLVRLAGERGLPVTIYRPNTGGHSATGVFNPNDHLPLLIKGCIQLGAIPEDLGLVVQ